MQTSRCGKCEEKEKREWTNTQNDKKTNKNIIMKRNVINSEIIPERKTKILVNWLKQLNLGPGMLEVRSYQATCLNSNEKEAN